MSNSTNSPAPHPHAELVKQWLDDTKQGIWYWIATAGPAGRWNPATINTLMGYEHLLFAIGEKPTAPPQRMCTLGGLQFPEPMREAPARGATYWVAGGIFQRKQPVEALWRGDEEDIEWLAAGLAHLTESAAIAHNRALAAANRQAIEAAK